MSFFDEFSTHFVVEYAHYYSDEFCDFFFPIWGDREEAESFCESHGIDFDKIKEVEL